MDLILDDLLSDRQVEVLDGLVAPSCFQNEVHHFFDRVVRYPVAHDVHCHQLLEELVRADPQKLSFVAHALYFDWFQASESQHALVNDALELLVVRDGFADYLLNLSNDLAFTEPDELKLVLLQRLLS